MRLANRRAAMLVALCAAGVLGACSNGRLDVNSAAVRGIAYVRVDDVMKHHPLYPQLAHIDDAIAMVGLAGVGPGVPLSAAAIAREDAQIKRQVQAAQLRTQRIIDQKRREYATREQAAIKAALSAAGVRNGADIAAQMNAVSARQAQQAQMQAGRDFVAYQQSVVAQSNTAAGAIVRQLQREADQKLRAKAEQEQQAETDLSLRLSQQDATQRLSIQTRLSMLALDDATRKQLQSQLAAMTSRENAALSAQRAADQTAFAAYRAQVIAQTNAQMRSALSTIRNQTQSKLVARRNEVGAQLRSMGAAPGAAPLTPATQAQIRQIAQQFQAQYQSDVQQVIMQYAQTRDALEAQYATLHGADVEANSAAAQETAILEQQRQQLYDQLLAQIQREAEQLAKKQGFRVVFADVTAAPGGYDMTNELITAIESLHE